MASVREEEIQRHRVAIASAFNCPFCIRMEDSRYAAAYVEEALSPSEERERYNNRRYAHYLDDFQSADALREHLHERVRYWFPLGGAELDAAIVGTESIVGWWEVAHMARTKRVPVST